MAAPTIASARATGPLPTRARNSPARICVFRALQLGDMICAGPALRALRQRFPDAHVTLVGLPWAADFAARMDVWIDDFVSFPGWPGLPERPVDHAALPDFLQRMRARRFDLAVQLHGSGQITNGIVREFGAARIAAHHPPAAPPAANDGDYWPYPETLHEVHRNLHLARRLGAPTDDDRVAFPLTAVDVRELQARFPALARLPERSYVCLHPGARAPEKRWPAAAFARVGDALAALGLHIVLSGNAAERELAAAVTAQMKSPAFNAACDISIGGLATLLARAGLLVSNDTGVAHVAAALALPSVIVFFATDPQRWAPLDHARHIALHAPSGVATDDVIEAARSLLAQPPD